MKKMLKQIALILILAIIPALNAETIGQALSRIDHLEKTYAALTHTGQRIDALTELQEMIRFYTAAKKLSRAERSENEFLSHSGISFTDGMIDSIISGLQQLNSKFSQKLGDSTPAKPKSRTICLPRLF